jgi:hypothetical protein
MKKLHTFSFCLLSVGMFAQSVPTQLGKAKATLEHHLDVSKRSHIQPIQTNGAETSTIWFEDFSNGLAGWNNLGYLDSITIDSNALWEYRGPNSSPDNSVGSRGFFSGINNVPPTNLPIASPTAANGFVIFDSDYLDNGNTNVPGSGVSPTPHMGTLESPIIDLSNHPDVIIELFSFARSYNARRFIAFSSDGGNTYPDTIEVANEFLINTITPRDYRTIANVSTFIGGESNARFKLIFDGKNRVIDTSSSSHGYYYWMVDDIAIKTAPNTLFAFEKSTLFNSDVESFVIEAENPTVWYNFFGGGIVNPGVYPSYTDMQTRGYSFGGNIRNIGTSTQTNVRIIAEVYSNGMLSSVISSSPRTITPGQIVNSNLLKTSPWSPTTNGVYDVVVKIISDSLDAADNSPNTVTDAPDTLSFERQFYNLGLHFNKFDNSIGTNQLGDDGSAIAMRFEVKEGSRGEIVGARLGLSPQSIAGGEVEFKIYRNNDLLTNDTPLFSARKTISAADITNQYIEMIFDSYGLNNGSIAFEYPTPNPIWSHAIKDSAFWLVAELYSSSGQFPVMVKNDRTTEPPYQSLMYDLGSSDWFSRFSFSRNFSRPHLTLLLCPSYLLHGCFVSVNTMDAQKNFIHVFPNPSSGKVTVEFFEAIGETAKLDITDLNGKTLLSEHVRPNANNQHQLDLSNFAAGMYILKVEMNGVRNTYKVNIEK